MAEDHVKEVRPSGYLPQHILVLAHGSHGTASDWNCFVETMSSLYNPQIHDILILPSKTNHSLTNRGVIEGGERIADEICQEILKYDLPSTAMTYKFSIIGHSLGGLYARYAILPLMMKLEPILNMEFISFITLCTPHLGVRRPHSDSKIKNILRMGIHKILSTNKIYGQTGADLLAEPATESNEADVEVEVPVLDEISDPSSPYITALQKFQHCTLIGVTNGDLVVQFTSATLRCLNPYRAYDLTETVFSTGISKVGPWNWHIYHTGFPKEQSISSVLGQHVNLPAEDIYQHIGLLGTDVTKHFRNRGSSEEYDCDEDEELEYKYHVMLSLQQAVPWRRIDLFIEPNGHIFTKFRCHDWVINKAQHGDARAEEFVALLCHIVAADFEIPISKTTVDTPKSVTTVDSPVADAAMDSQTDTSTDSPDDQTGMEIPKNETAADFTILEIAVDTPSTEKFAN